MDLLEILKVIVLGIVEGITEWLPISSTGHLIIVDEFIKFKMSDDFKEMFNVVIQLGAILAVVVLYYRKLWIVKRNQDTQKLQWDRDKLSLWLKIIVACIPAAVIGLAFDDKIDELFYNPYVVSATLIIYGIIFIIIELKNKNASFKYEDVKDISFKIAFIIGVSQILALIPGTSRSGITIIAALLVGTTRTAAAEFTFFLSIPIMAGASGVKILKYIFDGNSFNKMEIYYLLMGMLVAYMVSMIVIKFLMSFIKKHNFVPFGIYRILLGIGVLVYFLLA